MSSNQKARRRGDGEEGEREIKRYRGREGRRENAVMKTLVASERWIHACVLDSSLSHLSGGSAKRREEGECGKKRRKRERRRACEGSGASSSSVPVATGRLAARATLLPDAVWQRSQKATSERRRPCQASSVSVPPSLCQLAREPEWGKKSRCL